eukprot:scaffold24278_cov150-Skeletonema_marinoi.AAC.7
MDDGSSLSLLAWTPEAEAVSNMAKAVSLRKMHFMLTEVDWAEGAWLANPFGKSQQSEMQSKKQKRGSWSADGRMAVASGDKMHVL